jgi:ribosomal 50S subunit-recycling heat shock protein
VRLDLFLKTSRLVKRRAVARELCDAGRVLVNGQQAKPAKEVGPGNRVTMLFNTKSVEIEVLDLPPIAQRIDPVLLYRVIGETRKECGAET